MSARADIERVLRENGVNEQDGMHSWRCAYPETYGACSCFEELVNDLMKVTTHPTEGA